MWYVTTTKNADPDGRVSSGTTVYALVGPFDTPEEAVPYVDAARNAVEKRGYHEQATWWVFGVMYLPGRVKPGKLNDAVLVQLSLFGGAE